MTAVVDVPELRADEVLRLVEPMHLGWLAHRERLFRERLVVPHGRRLIGSCSS
jgi:hypothetical protein